MVHQEMVGLVRVSLSHMLVRVGGSENQYIECHTKLNLEELYRFYLHA
jgi:hypothetical protein